MSPEKRFATCRLNNMTFYGYHGALAWEKETGQRFEIDCEYCVEITGLAKTDSLKEAIDYTEVYNVINDIVTNHRFNLLETLAQRSADALFEAFELEWVRLTVRKISPPLAGIVESYEVEAERAK